jgi:hypothetical protein
MKMKLWFVRRGQLLFLNETSPDCLCGPEISVDATGVEDAPEHLAYCLAQLREMNGEFEKLAVAGNLRLTTLSSRMECLDEEVLAETGEAPGHQIIETTTAEGRSFTVWKDATYR